MRPVAVLALVCLAAGCSRVAPGRLVVGFSQIGADNPWRAAETKSIRDEAERRGITLKYADGQDRQEKQIADLRAFVAQGVDAILLAPKTNAGWEPVLRE